LTASPATVADTTRGLPGGNLFWPTGWLHGLPARAGADESQQAPEKHSIAAANNAALLRLESPPSTTTATAPNLAALSRPRPRAADSRYPSPDPAS
jgi:hypothetical protein